MCPSVVVLQAANVDATLSRLKRQHALAEEKKRLAADAAAAAERAIRDGQPLDPGFNPSRIGSGQFGNTEAENRAAAAAQLANQMSQVLHCDPLCLHLVLLAMIVCFPSRRAIMHVLCYRDVVR